MMADLDRQSLRGFLAQLEEELPEELLRITEPVRTHLDITSLVYELERLGKSPAVIFDNIEGHSMPVVTNIAGNRKVLALALGVAPRDLPTAFRERCTRYTPVELVNRPDWQAITIEGGDVDLTKFPIPLHFDIDAAPYITAGQLTARDPETGIDTTGFHRLMLKGRNRLGVSLHSRRRMWEFHRRAAAKGQNLPAAVPDVRGVGVDHRPHVVQGMDAERDEFTGYASFRSTQNVFVAKRIRMRSDAMFHSVVSGMSQDHILVSCITREGEILNALRRNPPNVNAVHVPHTTCGAFMAFISMKKTSEGEPQQAIMATLRTEFYTKYVIVVDEDVDVFSLSDVMWAVATRVRAEKDIIFIPGAKGAILDPTSDPNDFTLTKMGIDATKPLGQDFAARLTISDAQRARARAILAKAGFC